MSMMHTLAPTPHTLQDRFFAALEQVQDKLLHLLANSPLLLVAILIVLGAIWLGGVISRRMHVLNRISRNNPYMDGLLRNAVKVLVILAGVLVALDLLNATSLVGAVLGSAGVVGLVLGFAFKDIAENYIAGVLLSLRQPFSPGDSVRIEMKGKDGHSVFGAIDQTVASLHEAREDAQREAEAETAQSSEDTGEAA